MQYSQMTIALLVRSNIFPSPMTTLSRYRPWVVGAADTTRIIIVVTTTTTMRTAAPLTILNFGRRCCCISTPDVCRAPRRAPNFPRWTYPSAVNSRRPHQHPKTTTASSSVAHHRVSLSCTPWRPCNGRSRVWSPLFCGCTPNRARRRTSVATHPCTTRSCPTIRIPRGVTTTKDDTISSPG